MHDDRVHALDDRLTLVAKNISRTDLAQSSINQVADSCVQNLSSLAVHYLRDPQGQTTRCGWKAASHIQSGKAVIRECIFDTPFELICEGCLPQFRESKLVACEGDDPMSD